MMLAMKITVRFFASFMEAIGKNEEEIEVPEESTVDDVVLMIQKKHPEIGPVEGAIFVLEHRLVEGRAKVKDGDVIAMFPLVGGG